MKYQFLDKIEDSSLLAENLNKVMCELFLFRNVCAPRTFKSLQTSDKGTDMYMFYLSCLFDEYVHDCVTRLRTWQSVTNEYIEEYQGKWKYYAASKRLSAINEGFGSPEDFDEDGHIIQDNVTKEQLEYYSVVSDLYYDNWCDIVQDTEPKDLEWLRSSLQLQSSFDFVDAMKECFGAEIDSFKITYDEDGELISKEKMTREDRDLQRISESVECDDMYSFVINLCEAVQFICKKISALDKMKDNAEEIKEINRLVTGVLECNFNLYKV